MPFTGTGTGIQNADDVFFSGLAQNQVLRFNTSTAKWNNIALSVVTAEIADNAVTEPKLSASNVPTTNQLLSWDGSGLTWATVDKAFVGLGNVDNTSDASKPISSATQTALNAKASTATTVTGTSSVSGGGDLSANRTFSLVNDSATPGNSKYYGTDGTGTKGFYAIPTGNPAMGGDLSGTASTATIVAGAVTSGKIATSGVATTNIADSAVTEPKLSITNSPSTGQVLSWNGTAMAWAGALAFAYTKVSVTTDYTVTSSFQYVFADATSAGITITLPAPANNAYVRVKRMSTNANGVQIVAPAGSYLDAPAVGSDVLNNPYDSAEYWSDGTNWFR